MDREKIERINFLARKAKECPLSEEEKTEQTALRNEYREEFKKGFINTMNNTYVKDDEGNISKLLKQ